MSGDTSKQVSPTHEEVLEYFDTLSNWGRWGGDDELGTLNLLTPEVRLAAVRLVSEGEIVPLGMDLDADNPDPLGRGTKMSRETDIHKAGTKMQGVREWIGMMPHGSATHLDAPSHFAFDGTMYNGFPATEVTPDGGAAKLDVANARGGIVTRGVLLDVAGTRGVDWMEPGEGVTPDDLAAAEEAAGVEVRPGDFLIVRTGYLKRAFDTGDAGDLANGYHPSSLPWLKERDVAVVRATPSTTCSPRSTARTASSARTATTSAASTRSCSTCSSRSTPCRWSRWAPGSSTTSSSRSSSPPARASVAGSS